LRGNADDRNVLLPAAPNSNGSPDRSQTCQHRPGTVRFLASFGQETLETYGNMLHSVRPLSAPPMTNSPVKDIIMSNGICLSASAISLTLIKSLEKHVSTLKARKRELVKIYADAIRIVLASRLVYLYGDNNLSRKALDEHAKNVVVQVLREIDVRQWPPDEKTHAKVDQIIDEYLAALMFKGPGASNNGTGKS